MNISMPMNVFTIGACMILFIYFATRIGEKAANWQNAFIVVVLAILILCVGLAPMPIWHLFTGGH